MQRRLRTAQHLRTRIKTKIRDQVESCFKAITEPQVKKNKKNKKGEKEFVKNVKNLKDAQIDNMVELMYRICIMRHKLKVIMYSINK